MFPPTIFLSSIDGEDEQKAKKKITCGSVVLLMKTQILYVRVNIFILYTPCDVGKLMQRDNL